MNLKWLKDKQITIILFLILFILYLFIKLNNKNINEKQDIILKDTIYNTIILDSIKYNIIIRDSIITKLIYEYEDKIIKVSNMSDSASIELFKELCTNDSLYGQDR